MTDWIHYNASKYAAKCCYCNRDIHTSEGRWTAPHTDGTKGRFAACHNCIAPPAAGVSAGPPPKPNEVVTNDTRNDTQIPSVMTRTPEIPPSKPSVVVPSSDVSFTPMSPIAKAHEDNMLSYELTRLVMTKQTDALNMLCNACNALCNAMNERTRILNEQLKEGGKQ